MRNMIFAFLLLSGTSSAGEYFPCPRLKISFERCNLSDPCYLKVDLPYPSPDVKFETVNGILYLFTREPGSNDWQTSGYYENSHWNSLFHPDVYDRVNIVPDEVCE